MTVRLLEVVVADRMVPQIREVLAPRAHRMWQESVPHGSEKFSCIVAVHDVEPLLRDLTGANGDAEGFSAVVLEVEALAPPIAAHEPPRIEVADRPATALEQFLSRDRRSTDEIYDDVADSVSINLTYLMTVTLSAIIAALAMMTGQTAVVIGAMVIAPLLGPTLALAMAATVGDHGTGVRSLRTLALGAAMVVLCTLPLGALLEFDPMTPELHNRTIVHLADIALALASGFAGVLALNKGASSSLVGVMIAVALVPPLAASGIYFGSGDPELGLRALFLFASNLVCINISGILAFLIQGLPPRRWRITAGILAVWLGVLVLFVAVITGRVVMSLT